jgi:ATP-dependent DNA helicase
VKQRDLYDEIVEGRIRRVSLEKGIEDPLAGQKEVVDVNAPRKLREGKRRYDVDGRYFLNEWKGGWEGQGTKKTEEVVTEVGRQHRMRETGA